MSPDVRIYSNSGLYLDHRDLLYAAVDGINDIRILRGKVPCSYSGNDEERRLISCNEKFSYDKNRSQVDADALGFFLDSESRLYRPSPTNLIFTDRDLYIEEHPFVVGTTICDKNLSIQSVYRIIKATKDENLQKESVRYLARHNYTHLVGLKDSDDYVSPNIINGMAGGHCFDDHCTMHQALSVNEILHLVESQGYQDNIAGFCMDCIESLINKS